MIERKSKEICEKCDNFLKGRTKSGYPIFRCAIEHNPSKCKDGHIWHKLSTVLYTEPLPECPYYAEHLVTVLSDDINGNLKSSHARLGFDKKNVG